MADDPVDILTRFGKALRKRRVELGISQEQLADKSGLHRTYVGDVERGERNVSLKNVEKLVMALEISIADLFTAYVEGDE